MESMRKMKVEEEGRASKSLKKWFKAKPDADQKGGPTPTKNSEKDESGQQIKNGKVAVLRMNFEKDHEVNQKDVKKETRVKKMLGLFERFPTDPKEEMMKEGNKRKWKVLEDRWSKGRDTEKDERKGNSKKQRKVERTSENDNHDLKIIRDVNHEFNCLLGGSSRPENDDGMSEQLLEEIQKE